MKQNRSGERNSRGGNLIIGRNELIPYDYTETNTVHFHAEKISMKKTRERM